MLPIPSSAYGRFARILDLPGSESLSAIQSDVVATQDLTRMMQDRLCKRTLYTLTLSPAVTAAADVQWNDASDWTEVQVNGIVQVADTQLPLDTDERIIVAASLQIGATLASYTRCEAKRFLPDGVSSNMLIQSWGTLQTGFACPDPGVFLLPQYLTPGESTVRITQVVSADLADFFVSFHMISALPGVMSPYTGV